MKIGDPESTILCPIVQATGNMATKKPELIKESPIDSVEVEDPVETDFSQGLENVIPKEKDGFESVKKEEIIDDDLDDAESMFD